MPKPYARMRLHGPGMVFDWHETYEQAQRAIDECAAKLGDQIRIFQVVGYFKIKPKNLGQREVSHA